MYLRAGSSTYSHGFIKKMTSVCELFGFHLSESSKSKILDLIKPFYISLITIGELSMS